MQGISGRNSQRVLQLCQLPTGRGMGLRPMFSLSRATYPTHKTPEAPSAPAASFLLLFLEQHGHVASAPPPAKAVRHRPRIPQAYTRA